MSVDIQAKSVLELGAGVWQISMSPKQVRLFGEPSVVSQGHRSVVLVDGAVFDKETRVLSFPADGALAINLGDCDDVLLISTQGGSSYVSSQSHAAANVIDVEYGYGDRDFLDMARRLLSEQMYIAAAKLLAGVRERSSGSLKRGKTRNFSETPDNFWYVIIQPRIDELSITVRGPVEHFEGYGSLEIKDDRGNTRFKVKSEKDVPEALKMIFRAKRKI